MRIVHRYIILMVSAFALTSSPSGFAAKGDSGGAAAGHKAKGIELAQARQYDAAIAEFSAAIAANPKDSGAYHDRGTAYRAAQKFPEAIADFTKEIEVAPTDPAGYLERGQT